MKYYVRIDGKEKTIDLQALDTGGFRCQIDEQPPFDCQAMLDAPRIHLLGSTLAAHPSISLDSGDISVGGGRRELTVESRRLRSLREATGSSTDGAQDGLIVSPMPGRVVKNLVSEGDMVVAGEGVVVVEAMKMENELKASASGVVTKLYADTGDLVEAKAPLVEIKPPSSE